MIENYVYPIVALLPLAAIMLVVQVNPYHALVIRGILGALAALIYAVLGAPDVALTEALVGTMLSIMLYAVAVRSSMVMRLGIVEEAHSPLDLKSDRFTQLQEELRLILNRYALRLELVPYPNLQMLHQALIDKEIHGTCIQPDSPNPHESEDTPYQMTIRIERLYQILQGGLSPSITHLTYLDRFLLETSAKDPLVKVGEQVTLSSEEKY